MKITSRVICSLIICILHIAAGDSAVAQQYPMKPVNLIVGWPPGGGADIVARTLGHKLAENWGQPIVVINRPGADNIIAYDSVARSAPDGYTLLLVTTEFAINPSVHPKLPYDAVRDFAAVAPAASAPYILVVHPSVPVTSAQELIAFAKSRPGQLNFASSGASVRLAAVLFNSMARLKMADIPYKGGPQAIGDVVGGHVSLMFPSLPTGLPHVRAGKVRALGVTSAQRSTIVPDMPTVAESGLPGYEANQWWGLVVPAGTQQHIISRLNTEILKLLASHDVKQQLFSQGIEPTGSSPEQFAVYIQAQIAKWSVVVKNASAGS
jgi:tripartite-type tricarboxylate transporter receptor subunit TctC